MKTKPCIGILVCLLGVSALARADVPLASYGVTWEKRPDYSVRSGVDAAYQAQLSYIDGNSQIDNNSFGIAPIDAFSFDFDSKGRALVSIVKPVTADGDRSDARYSSIRLLYLNEGERTLSRYVLQGEVLCDGIEGYGYLQSEMKWKGQGGSGENVVCGVAPEERFQGSSDWRPFSIICTGNPAGNSSSSLEVYLKWAGTGKVSFRNVKLVEYRHVFPMTPMEQKQAAKWAWIGGTPGAVVGLGGGAVLVAVIVRRLRRQRREEELRKISAAD